MILKRSEEYTPIIMVGCDKKYLEINLDTYGRVYPSANDSYKFTITENCNAVKFFSPSRQNYYKEFYGALFGNIGKIIAIVVEDEGNKRFLIVSDSNFNNAQLSRLRKSITIHGVSRKNIVSLSQVEIDRMFLFNLDYSIKDLSKPVQSEIVKRVMSEIKSKLPSEEELRPKKQPHIFNTGDWITITKSDRNWAEGMNQYVGLTIILTRDGSFQHLDIDGGCYNWCYKDGHFRHATKEEILNAKNGTQLVESSEPIEPF